MTKSMQTIYKYKLIKTEKEYDSALERLEVVFDEPTNSLLGEEAELLALLIEDYESRHYPIIPF